MSLTQLEILILIFVCQTIISPDKTGYDKLLISVFVKDYLEEVKYMWKNRSFIITFTAELIALQFLWLFIIFLDYSPLFMFELFNFFFVSKKCTLIASLARKFFLL